MNNRFPWLFGDNFLIAIKRVELDFRSPYFIYSLGTFNKFDTIVIKMIKLAESYVLTGVALLKLSREASITA